MRWVPLVVLFAACSSMAEVGPRARVWPEPYEHAWWLRIEFEPTGRVIRGIPIEEIDPSWTRASELRKEAIPKDILSEGGTDNMAASGLVFARYGDFDKNGIEDLALVGVFEHRSGERGTFLLVLTREGGVWRRVFLEAHQGRAGFLALSEKSENIQVWTCMHCDAVGILIWDEKGGQYRWLHVDKSRQ